LATYDVSYEFAETGDQKVTQTQRNAAILRKMQKYTQANTKSKKAAQAALVRQGFYLTNGEPAPEFADEKKVA
jgi:hypothetical protein